MPKLNLEHYPLDIAEEELKNKVAKDFFASFDATKIIENIDFCVVQNKNLFNSNALLWAEAKKAKSNDLYTSLTQLILTIGKAKIHEKQLPPEFLGSFNAQKIAFLPTSEILEIFNQSDFNWNVRPSDYTTKEFKQLYAQSEKILTQKSLVFNFFENGEKNEKLLYFIKNDFIVGWGKGKQIGITKSNFIGVYQEWLKDVKPSIRLEFIDESGQQKEHNPADFYLADLLSKNNQSLKINLKVILAGGHYEKINPNGEETIIKFKDEQKAHKDFWYRYERPPIKEVQKHILLRRDLLVPSDIRERKGAFFTPSKWVNLAQNYLADVLGDEWQENYYIWDCCAGTGNLLANLQNKRQIFASTIDDGDVKIMQDIAKNNDKSSFFENHIFQFDFLNDEFFDILGEKGEILKKSKIPLNLQEILKDPKKREKLIIFINPPYAEAGNYLEKNKNKVAKNNKICQKYKNELGNATNELYAQFFMRIYKEISGCILASFSTPKYLNSQNFIKFREHFKAEFLKGFVCSADTFENVKGGFPINFIIWNLAKKQNLKQIWLDIFNADGTKKTEKKTFISHKNKSEYITAWLSKFEDRNDEKNFGILMADAPDFQCNNHVALINKKGKAHFIYKKITALNLIPFFVYFAVRQAIDLDWLINKNQFLYPNEKWQKDEEFKNDCLIFALFHGQNKISARNVGGGE